MHIVFTILHATALYFTHNDDENLFFSSTSFLTDLEVSERTWHIAFLRSRCVTDYRLSVSVKRRQQWS